MPVMKVIPGTTKPERRVSLVTKRSVPAAAADLMDRDIFRPEAFDEPISGLMLPQLLSDAEHRQNRIFQPCVWFPAGILHSPNEAHSVSLSILNKDNGESDSAVRRSVP
jgi:hypothetical protein